MLRQLRRSWIFPVALSAVALIVVIDWLTPAGVVVGILLSMPILLTSFTEDPWVPRVTAAVAMIGFLLAAAFGRGPISPAAVWAPNRLFAFLTLPGSLVLARLLQDVRRKVSGERERAARASDLNRLLLSLLAHDMRAPLGMAVQALDYLRSASAAGAVADGSLIADVEARLRRGLGSIDRILSVARDETGRAHVDVPRRTGEQITSELASEVASFELEAGARNKALRVSLAAPPGEEYSVDLLMARQAVAILVDNAIRHAAPGTVRVSGGIDGGELRIVVADPGPAAVSCDLEQDASKGSGLGLVLCRTLIERAGGHLEVRNRAGTGSEVTLQLPLVTD